MTHKPTRAQGIRNLSQRRACPRCHRQDVPTVGGKLARHWPPGTVILCAADAPPACGYTGAGARTAQWEPANRMEEAV